MRKINRIAVILFIVLLAIAQSTTLFPEQHKPAIQQDHMEHQEMQEGHPRFTACFPSPKYVKIKTANHLTRTD